MFYIFNRYFESAGNQISSSWWTGRWFQLLSSVGGAVPKWSNSTADCFLHSARAHGWILICLFLICCLDAETCGCRIAGYKWIEGGVMWSFIIPPPQFSSSEIKLWSDQSFLEPASRHILLLPSRKWTCKCLPLPFKMEWKADQMIRKYLSSDSPSKRPASADRSVRPDIAAEYIFRFPACVQRHTFGRRRGCKKKKKNWQKKVVNIFKKC